LPGATHETGRLVRATSADGHARELSYDTAGRVRGDTTIIRGERLSYGVEYDYAGRTGVLTYPATSDGHVFAARFGYANGELGWVVDAATGFPFWQRERVDNAGRTVQSLTGDSVREVRGYDFRDDLISQRASGPSGTIQDLEYDLDAKGLMIARRDRLQPARELFLAAAKTESPAGTLVALTRAEPGPPARALAAKLAEQERHIEWEDLRDEWAYLVLAFVHHRVADRAEALRTVELVYAHLNFPAAIGSLVAYLNPEKTEQQLIDEWQQYLNEATVRYAR